MAAVDRGNEARTQLKQVVAQAPEYSLATFLLAILEDESGNITGDIFNNDPSNRNII